MQRETVNPRKRTGDCCENKGVNIGDKQPPELLQSEPDSDSLNLLRAACSPYVFLEPCDSSYLVVRQTHLRPLDILHIQRIYQVYEVLQRHQEALLLIPVDDIEETHVFNRASV